MIRTKLPVKTRSIPVHSTIASFRAAMDAVRAEGHTIGLVPTMGALHDGHASLIRRAAEDCDVVAVTIFVNPTQFAAGEDFERYPRDLKNDGTFAIFAAFTADGARQRRATRPDQCPPVHLFAPPLGEMYPGAPDGRGGLTTVHVAVMSEGMEGAARPTHFDGVATVVTKLFNIAGPCRAYFGEKDWQQLQVVRQLVYDLDVPVEVVGCPTVRESDGLALSSRNAYLSADERRAATVLYRALVAGREHPDDPVEAAQRVVESEPLAQLDYVKLLGNRLLIAARVGTTRLIDNMEL